jgi:GT2 family glycosyltransferase
MTTREPQPRVSVCIANYNGEALLDDCIGSVLAQGIDVEILVHDDASTDGSLTLLASRYPQARVIASTENVGFCVANNRMADAATGEYLLLLNNDAALQAGALQALLSEASRIGGEAILTLPQYDWGTGGLVDRGCLLDPFYNPVPNLDPKRDGVAYVIGACLWIPRRLWHELGGFPAWFGSLAEDMFLCCAARLRGVPVRCVDGSGYRHRQGASFGGNRADGGLRTTYRRRALSERNKTWVLLACTPGWIAWPLLAVHVAILSLEGLALSIMKADARPLREIYAPAIASIHRDWSALLALRRLAQSTRTRDSIGYFGAFRLVPRKLVLLWAHRLPRID